MELNRIQALASIVFIFAAFGLVNCIPDMEVCLYNSSITVSMESYPINDNEDVAQLTKSQRRKACRQVWTWIANTFPQYAKPAEILTPHYFTIGGVVRPGILCSENPLVVVAKRNGVVTGFKAEE